MTAPPSILSMFTAPPTCARRSGSRVAGFTLTELLVAITLITAMLAITLGGFFGRKDTNRIFATEQLVADFVRQARHAARSSGEPVALRIIQVADRTGRIIGGRIAGVSRSPVWTQSFDDINNFDKPTTISLAYTPGGGVAAQDPDPATGLTLGRTGNGIWPVVLTAAGVPTGNLATMLQHRLTTSQNLVRASGAADGFFLACAVRPPSAVATWNALIPAPAPSSREGLDIPLVVLGGFADNAAASSCIAGLKLVLYRFTASATGVPPHDIYCWQLVGWVNQPGSTAVTTTLTSLDGVDATYGPANPICGERWEDLGLLYDGSTLTLYRNGVALTTAPATGTTTSAPILLSTSLPSPNLLVSPASETVFIGQLLPNGGTTMEYADAPLDDIRILRVGTDQIQDLPSTVVPDVHGTLVFRPDGTSSFTPDPATPDLPALLLATPLLGNPVPVPAGTITITMPQGPLAVTPQSMAPGTLLFSRRTHGLRDGGANNAAVIFLPPGGPPISALATIGRDPNNMANSYIVYNQPRSGP